MSDRPLTPPAAAQHAHINYFTKSRSDRLALFQGDADTFSDIIGLLAEYEGVLERHESFASNLGAKLTGPRLLKGIDKFFEGPIKTHPAMTLSYQVSWLDIYNYAKSHPNEFTLTNLSDGTRVCQFICKGFRVEINEDDWRFISSGALNRIPLEHPLEEDETAELATLDILEQRASVLYKKADEVAARARILHHKLGQRKAEIYRRRQYRDGEVAASGPGTGPGFMAVNHQQQQPLRSNQGSSSNTYDLHQDLLQQFLSTPPPQPSSSSQSRSASTAGISQGSPHLMSAMSHHQQQPNRGAGTGGAGPSRPTTSDEPPPDVFRPLITQKIDKLTRGDVIQPPCDRCRRLKLTCVKHLTACQGCTKKHAKCSWKAVTEEEAARIKQEIAVPVETREQPQQQQQQQQPQQPPLQQTSDGDTEIPDRGPDREHSVPSQSTSTPTPTPQTLHHHHHQHHMHNPPADVVLAPINSPEGQRPESRGGDISGPAAFGAHNILLPPMKIRTALPQAPPSQHKRSGTPLGHPSPNPYQTEQRRSWASQNNSSG